MNIIHGFDITAAAIPLPELCETAGKICKELIIQYKHVIENKIISFSLVLMYPTACLCVLLWGLQYCY
jgi:hypothetical protein